MSRSIKRPTNQQLVELFHEVGQAIKACEWQKSPQIGESLTLQQARALLFIHGKGSVTMGEIATHFRITRASATSLIRRLVQAGWAKRLVDSSDGRIVKLALTPSSKRRFQAVMDHKMQRMGELISVLNPTDRQDLYRILTHLKLSIQKTS